MRSVCLKTGVYLKLSLIFILFLFSSIKEVSSAAAAAAASASDSRVEEGWRYSIGGLKVCIYSSELTDAGTQILDLNPHHQSLAYLGQEASESALSFGETTSATSIFRFTPVIIEGGKARLGKPVKVTDAIMTHGETLLMVDDLPVYETAFMSGFSAVDRTGPLVKHIQPLPLKAEATSREKPNAFAVLPPFNPEKKATERGLATRPFPLRLMQRSYVDPELFFRNIRFRYPISPDGTCFVTGDYSLLQEIHGEGLGKLEARNIEITERFVGLTRLATTGDISEVNAALETLKGSLKGFHNVAEANSYTCAEQSALDFIQDVRVIAYLEAALGIKDPLVKGIIVNVHCSDTPCSTCATSLARESQRGGIFRRISHEKPVSIICSCRNHYQRKVPSILYPQTRWLEGARLSADESSLEGEILEPHSFHLEDSDRFSPMPVVLLKYVKERGVFEPDVEQYTRFVKSLAS